ncbi:YlmC/YmxH family sporulation protein|uniref:Sporulation protein, YlmC/YmxH family n=1 Tax=Dendrosporobacter quercicolus TaxID=146817 RepID=A0A1G9LN28_9FIRM|nr:YlmC/YmxH family sporulation protein [Dendrosporobacter quercicolus]NSL46764.1 YlmC/YmxH family sporulation protein [Dendrosporobacter quercicolus DSM 1736]SDL63187.1 sporulation protein, YlmC/YmxH family [Dendrosporobacter quercicolus]
MRLSELTGKEVINIGDGGRLGIIDDCDLSFDAKSGRINSLMLPNRSGFFNLFSDHKTSAIPWPAIKRIGDEVIIVDLNNAFDRMYANSRRERQGSTY